MVTILDCLVIIGMAGGFTLAALLGLFAEANPDKPDRYCRPTRPGRSCR